jgi:hypothetical protein
MMRTEEEIRDRKHELQNMFLGNKVAKDKKKIVVAGVRELDWVLGGSDGS